MAMEIGRLTHKGEVLVIRKTRYTGNDRLAILAHTSDGAPYAEVSTYIGDYDFAADELMVPTWEEREPLLTALLETGLFADTGREIEVEGDIAYVWRLAS